MAKTHTTLDLDRELLLEAAGVLGTTKTTDTIHAALRAVVARHRRRWLAERDFSELDRLTPAIRSPRLGPPPEPAAPEPAAPASTQGET